MPTGAPAVCEFALLQPHAVSALNYVWRVSQLNRKEGFEDDSRVFPQDGGGVANCRDQIMKNLKPKFNLDIEVKYIWEMVADALIPEE